MNNHDYQKLYEQVNKELVTPEWRAKLAKLVEHAADPLAADFKALATERDSLRRLCREAAEILVLNGLTATAKALIESVDDAARIHADAKGTP